MESVIIFLLSAMDVCLNICTLGLWGWISGNRKVYFRIK